MEWRTLNNVLIVTKTNEALIWIRKYLDVKYLIDRRCLRVIAKGQPLFFESSLTGIVLYYGSCIDTLVPYYPFILISCTDSGQWNICTVFILQSFIHETRAGDKVTRVMTVISRSVTLFRSVSEIFICL